MKNLTGRDESPRGVMKIGTNFARCDVCAPERFILSGYKVRRCLVELKRYSSTTAALARIFFLSFFPARALYKPSFSGREVGGWGEARGEQCELD